MVNLKLQALAQQQHQQQQQAAMTYTATHSISNSGGNALSHTPITNSNNNECTVYLGDLDMDITERQLKDFFAASAISVAKVVKQPHSSFAHITFFHAQMARKLLDNAVVVLHNRAVRVMPFNQPANFDPEANLIIKNLEPTLTEADIVAKFKPYGSILSCKLARDDLGHSKCYAYLQYETRDSAQLVIDRLNNTYWDERCDPDFKYKRFQEKLVALKKNTLLSKNELQMQESQLFAELQGKIGKKIYVGVFKKKNEYSKIKSSKEGKPSNLYVKNFGTAFGDRDLFNLFKAFGSIKSAKVRRMRIGLVEKPLGCGFVDFEYPDEAEKARASLDGFPLSSGRVLSVTYADCKSRRLRKKLELDSEMISGGDGNNEMMENEQDEEGGKSMASTASVSPSISPAPTTLTIEDNGNTVAPHHNHNSQSNLVDFADEYTTSGDMRSRNVSVGSELSTDSYASSATSSMTSSSSSSSSSANFVMTPREEEVSAFFVHQKQYNNHAYHQLQLQQQQQAMFKFPLLSTSNNQCIVSGGLQSPVWPNQWSKVLNTVDWSEYKLFDSGFRLF
jgi:RNA recognition motif-containing protein